MNYKQYERMNRQKDSIPCECGIWEWRSGSTGNWIIMNEITSDFVKFIPIF